MEFAGELEGPLFKSQVSEVRYKFMQSRYYRARAGTTPPCSIQIPCGSALGGDTVPGVTRRHIRSGLGSSRAKATSIAWSAQSSLGHLGAR
jgi:hypothetical protein